MYIRKLAYFLVYSISCEKVNCYEMGWMVESFSDMLWCINRLLEG
jgi:hypothetical protein